MSTFHNTESKVIRCCDVIFRREDFLFAYVEDNSIVIMIKSHRPSLEGYSASEELYATCVGHKAIEEELSELYMALG